MGRISDAHHRNGPANYCTAHAAHPVTYTETLTLHRQPPAIVQAGLGEAERKASLDGFTRLISRYTQAGLGWFSGVVCNRWSPLALRGEPRHLLFHTPGFFIGCDQFGPGHNIGIGVVNDLAHDASFAGFVF
jgi:hypothetical protein